jgi:hypothetical protein
LSHVLESIAQQSHELCQEAETNRYGDKKHARIDFLAAHLHAANAKELKVTGEINDLNSSEKLCMILGQIDKDLHVCWKLMQKKEALKLTGIVLFGDVVQMTCHRATKPLFHSLLYAGPA